MGKINHSINNPDPEGIHKHKWVSSTKKSLNSSTFCVSSIPTWREEERSPSPWEPSEVLEEDSLSWSAERQRSMLAEELVTSAKPKLKSLLISLMIPSEMASPSGSLTDKETSEITHTLNWPPILWILRSEKILKEWRRLDKTEVLDTSGDLRSEVNTVSPLVEEVLPSVSSERKSEMVVLLCSIYSCLSGSRMTVLIQKLVVHLQINFSTWSSWCLSPKPDRKFSRDREIWLAYKQRGMIKNTPTSIPWPWWWRNSWKALLCLLIVRGTSSKKSFPENCLLKTILEAELSW